LYVSYDGMADPLGQSQVLPYLRRLARRGHRFELVSFEKPNNRDLFFRMPLEPGIRWTALRYHKEPSVPATLFDMTQGLAASAIAALAVRADLIHVRSYVAATLALPLAMLARRPLLFDMRGLWPEERIENGTWSKSGRTYRAAKVVESVLVRKASAISVLTNAMQRHLRNEPEFRGRIRAPIHVIPTCTDLSHFTPDGPKDREIEELTHGCRVLGYVGSFGGRYLSKEMAEFYLHWRRTLAPARLLVISGEDPHQIREVLERAGVTPELIHRRSTREQIPAYLRCMDAGMFFHPPTVTNRGVAPTKVAEMLACGVPVVGTDIGDAVHALQGGDAGLVLPDLTNASMERAVRELTPRIGRQATRAAARQLAEAWYSLDAAADAYESLYFSLLDRNATPRDEAWPRS
jgi:glycosyltransferase involved in cell wall biosynthesis